MGTNDSSYGWWREELRQRRQERRQRQRQKQGKGKERWQRQRQRQKQGERMEGKGKEDPRSLSSLIVMRACSSPRARRTHCVPSTWYPASLSTERSASLSMARMEQRPSIASGILSVLRSRLLFLVA